MSATGLSETELRDLVYAVRDPDAIFIPRVRAKRPRGRLRARRLVVQLGRCQGGALAGDVRGCESVPMATRPTTTRSTSAPRQATRVLAEARRRGMLDWLPEEILRRFGEVGQPLLGPASARVRSELVNEAANGLQELGYSCEEDKDLVLAALGEEEW